MSTKSTSENGAALMFCRLSLERCTVYMAHLYACIHLTGMQEEGFLEIMAGMERELAFSRDLLGNL